MDGLFVKKIETFCALLRIKHYIKNVLVFIPLVFSGELTDPRLIRKSVGGFIFFCLVSSIVYIINDIQDYEFDRNHQTKKERPIASGLISKKNAYITIGLLFILFCVLSISLNTSGGGIANLIGIPLLYLMLNVAYSLGMKNIAILDVVIIATGFIFRTVYGGVIINVEISNWVYLTVISGSLYLGLGKRKKELDRMSIHPTRKVLTDYSTNFLDKNMYMCLTLCLMFYSLACIDIKTKAAQMGGDLIWTVPLVLVISLRYNMDLEGKSEGDPTGIILGDKWLILLILGFILGIIFTIYFANT